MSMDSQTGRFTNTILIFKELSRFILTFFVANIMLDRRDFAFLNILIQHLHQLLRQWMDSNSRDEK